MPGAAGKDTSVAVTGAYSISGLTPGSYIVCEVQQATWLHRYPTGPDQCTRNPTLGVFCMVLPPPTGKLFPYTTLFRSRKATVQGRKFDDRNADGSGSGDPGQGGFVIN